MGKQLHWKIKYNYVMRYRQGESPTKLGREINPNLKKNPLKNIDQREDLLALIFTKIKKVLHRRIPSSRQKVCHLVQVTERVS